MTQPIDDPKFATDATYTSGTDIGLANKLALSTGLRAQGLSRDDYYPARAINQLLHTHGGYLDGLVDIAAYNWQEHTTSEGDSEIENVYNAGYALVTLPPLDETDTEHLCFFNPAGPFYSADDGSRESWTQMAAPGTGGTVKGIIPGYANGVPHVICWDGSSTGAKQVRRSADNGAGWSDGGTVGADITRGIYSPTFGRWFLTGSVDFNTATIHYSEDLADLAWSTLPTPPEWNGALYFPSCIAEGSDGVAIGIAALGCVYAPDGENFVYSEVGDDTSATIAVCFSEARQEWLAWRADRTCWRAPPGMGSWTQVFDGAAAEIGPTAAPSTATGSLLIPFGRSYILAGPRINVSHDGGASWDRLPVKSFAANNWTALTKIGGRIVAAALITEGSNANLELVKSLRMPLECT